MSSVLPSVGPRPPNTDSPDRKKIKSEEHQPPVQARAIGKPPSNPSMTPAQHPDRRKKLLQREMQHLMSGLPLKDFEFKTKPPQRESAGQVPASPKKAHPSLSITIAQPVKISKPFEPEVYTPLTRAALKSLQTGNEAALEQKRADNLNILQELQKRVGKILPPVAEPPRPKTIRDVVFEEGVIVAREFAREFHWKRLSANKFANQSREKILSSRDESAIQEKISQLKNQRSAAKIVVEVSAFWSKLRASSHQALFANDSSVMKMDTPQKLSLDQSKFRSEVDKLSKLAASLNPMISKSRSKASQVASLRPYQSQAIDWLRQLQKKNCPAIYADEEGLGKRVVILNFLSQVKRGKPHLIVTSKGSLAYWLYEASRHASNLKLFSCLNAEDANIAKNQQNMFDICLSTFDCLLRFWDRLGFDCHYSYLILDDAVCSSLSSSGLFTEPIFSKICLNLDYDHLIVVSRNRPSLQKEIYLKHYLRLLCSKSIQKIGDALLNIFTEQELIAFVKPFILQRDRSEVVDEFVLPQTKLFRYSLSELQLDRYKSLKRKLNELDFTSDGLNFYETFFRGVAKLRNICSAFPKKNLPPLRTELGSPLLEINRTPIDRFSNLFSPCNLNGFSSFSHLPTGSYYLHEDGYLMSQNDGHFRFLLNLGDIFSQNTFGSVDFKAQESVFTQYSDLYQDSLSCTLPHWIDLNSNRLSRDEEERISLKLLSRSSVRQSSISTAKFRKLITILDSLARANHEKVVIFGQSRLLLENLSSALRLMRKNNFNFASRSLEIGDEVLSRYSIFLMPTRVDKLFLQKVNPSYVVFYENDWNPLIDVTLRNLCSSLPNLKMIFYLIHVGGLIDAAIVSCMDQFSNINSILSREYDGLNSDIFSHANYPALLSPFDQKDENLASQFHNSLAIQKALINSEEISSQDDLKYIYNTEFAIEKDYIDQFGGVLFGPFFGQRFSTAIKKLRPIQKWACLSIQNDIDSILSLSSSGTRHHDDYQILSTNAQITYLEDELRARTGSTKSQKFFPTLTFEKKLLENTPCSVQISSAIKCEITEKPKLLLSKPLEDDMTPQISFDFKKTVDHPGAIFSSIETIQRMLKKKKKAKGTMLKFKPKTKPGSDIKLATVRASENISTRHGIRVRLARHKLPVQFQKSKSKSLQSKYHGYPHLIACMVDSKSASGLSEKSESLAFDPQLFTSRPSFSALEDTLLIQMVAEIGPLWSLINQMIRAQPCFRGVFRSDKELHDRYEELNQSITQVDRKRYSDSLGHQSFKTLSSCMNHIQTYAQACRNSLKIPVEQSEATITTTSGSTTYTFLPAHSSHSRALENSHRRLNVPLDMLCRTLNPWQIIELRSHRESRAAATASIPSSSVTKASASSRSSQPARAQQARQTA